MKNGENLERTVISIPETGTSQEKICQYEEFHIRMLYEYQEGSTFEQYIPFCHQTKSELPYQERTQDLIDQTTNSLELYSRFNFLTKEQKQEKNTLEMYLPVLREELQNCMQCSEDQDLFLENSM